jgi:hypothetical protein
MTNDNVSKSCRTSQITWDLIDEQAKLELRSTNNFIIFAVLSYIKQRKAERMAGLTNGK